MKPTPYLPFRLVFIFCALFLIFSQTKVPAAETDQQIRTKVELLQLSPRVLSIYATYVGNLKPYKKVSISSEIAGIVEELNVKQGSRVKKDDILVKIDTKRQLLNKELNESNYLLALKDYERENKLLEKQLSTPAKVASLKNNLEVNRLKLELAELDLVRSKITAPIKGIISNPEIEVGEYVRVGSNLLEILDLSKVLGVINIPERDIRFIEQGKEVYVTVDALPDKEFMGYIKTVGLEADKLSRTFEIEIQIENPESVLLPGMLIRARLLKIHSQNQVIIPRHTIQEEEKGSFVYIVKDSKTVKRNIKIGLSVKDEVQVLTGLSFGDRLVETGQQLISPDEPVEVVAVKKQD